LQARLGGPNGPVIAAAAVDEFELSASAKQGMKYIETFSDGTILTEATLTMHPLVPGLDVRMNAFVSGCTFDDSTTSRRITSAAFVAQPDGRGIYTYRMLLAPTGWYHLCHKTQVFQNSTLISP
jgi:hypothetical protein